MCINREISEVRTIKLKADGKDVELRVYMHLYLDPIRKVNHNRYPLFGHVLQVFPPGCG